MTTNRTKKTINVDKKVKKKPIYEDKRVEPDPGGQPGIEFSELTPELEAFCQLIADNTPKDQIMTLIPNMSRYKYKTWLERENVKARIEEIKVETLSYSFSQLEPTMIGLIVGLTRYFKVKAAMLDLSDSVADKVLERAIDFCKVLSPIATSTSSKKGKMDTVSDNTEQPENGERKPIWSEEDYEDIEDQDTDETNAPKND